MGRMALDKEENKKRALVAQREKKKVERLQQNLLKETEERKMQAETVKEKLLRAKAKLKTIEEIVALLKTYQKGEISMAQLIQSLTADAKKFKGQAELDTLIASLKTVKTEGSRESHAQLVSDITSIWQKSAPTKLINAKKALTVLEAKAKTQAAEPKEIVTLLKTYQKGVISKAQLIQSLMADAKNFKSQAKVDKIIASLKKVKNEGSRESQAQLVNDITSIWQKSAPTEPKEIVTLLKTYQKGVISKAQLIQSLMADAKKFKGQAELDTLIASLKKVKTEGSRESHAQLVNDITSIWQKSP